jgi:hypothetical protein
METVEPLRLAVQVRFEVIQVGQKKQTVYEDVQSEMK